MTDFISASQIRSMFSAAMSAMYRQEVPAYGQLVAIVEGLNAKAIADDQHSLSHLDADEDLARLSAERHGAIRLGTGQELATMARIFAVMGMEPVGYYDLSVASVPVHSTAFRPVDRGALAENPFRVFTSLLRLELIEDQELRDRAEAALNARAIFSDDALALTGLAETQGGLDADQAERFVSAVLETFRWHAEAQVDAATFQALIQAHRLIADVVSFKGPHINHLTPRTLDIDGAQAAMIDQGLPAKAVIEGPPARQCPILLRQTAFKALEEPIWFPDETGEAHQGTHTARFGEIEQRGAALTPKGRALYDRLLSDVRAQITPEPDGSNADAYVAALKAGFEHFPDTWRQMHDQGLAYFKYRLVGQALVTADQLPQALDQGSVELSPIIYEDFLPVSAAGIFQSNLGDDAKSTTQASSSQAVFERALGRQVMNEFEQYEAIQRQSLESCLVA